MLKFPRHSKNLSRELEQLVIGEHDTSDDNMEISELQMGAACFTQEPDTHGSTGADNKNRNQDTDDDDDDDDADIIARYQYKRNPSAVMANQHPEIMVKSSVTSTTSHSIAPGEGKIPTNLMRESTWDVDAFPNLHPTGKFGIHYNRETKLPPWQYVLQRLYNVNRQFATSTTLLFASMYFLERHSLESQINISCLKGSISSDKVFQGVKDPLSVLQQVPGSPKYWQTERYKIVAKLENLGPFTFFFTLSCADKRWMENFTTILHQEGHTVSYEIHDGEEIILVNGQPIQQYVKDQNLHEMVRQNVPTVARNFNQRVRSMLKHIVMGKNSPMCVEFYNYRVEFQMRGAGHIHGILWTDLPKLEQSFPGITACIKKLRNQERLDDAQCDTVANFVDSFTTCSLHTENVAEIVAEVQIHNHSKTCRKKGNDCRFGYPKFPSDRTIIAQALDDKLYDSKEAKQGIMKVHKANLEAVKTVLKELKQADYSKTTIADILKQSGVTPDEYYKALSVTSKGTVIVLKRTVDEIYVNNYNPEWIKAWNGNMDLQVCLDYFAIITYITDYYSKDESGTLQFLIEAMKESTSKQPEERMRIIANTYSTHRLKGEFECVYSIDPNMHLTDSNIKTTWIDTGLPDTRRKLLRKISDEDEPGDGTSTEHVQTDPNAITIPGKEGRYMVNSSSLLDKYASRPDTLDSLTLCQFAKMYEPLPKNSKMDKTSNGIHALSAWLIANASEEKPEFLPRIIHVCKGYMKIRKKPSVLRFKEYREDKEPHAYIYAELLLYHPWRNEDELHHDDLNDCLKLYQTYRENIVIVKNKVFPHKNNVEEGRAFVDSLDDCHATHIGDLLDAEHEKETEEQAEIGKEIDDDNLPRMPDDALINLEIHDVPDGVAVYRRIDVSDTEKMRSDVRFLDRDQRMVFDIVIKFTKDIAKGLNEKHIMPPKLIVHGGAGSGKSTIINVLSRWVEKILRKDDDRHPDQPYIVITAPTGCAATNIKGTTLHSAFRLPFKNEFISLSDEQRDTQRILLSRMKVLIIDEISMVKADQVYQINLRLQELKQNHLDFGGVAVILFGDLMQLKPVQGRYIFEEPKNASHNLSCVTRSLWRQFQVVDLRFNHRQGEDGIYADLLNRIRFGKPTENDIQILMERHTDDPPMDGLHLFAMNKDVNMFNENKLNEIDGDVVALEASCIHPTIKDYKPQISSDGTTIKDAPFLYKLKLKIGARVMITYNINTSDGIVNGSLGTVRGFDRQAKDNSVRDILVMFDDKESGKLLRSMKRRSDGLTPIGRVSYQQSIGKNNMQNATKVKIVQFPIKLAWALTVHKCQGQTIRKPLKLVGHMKKVHHEAQAYVLLGRVQSLDQLILTDFTKDKIKVNQTAVAEANRLSQISLNRNNPWYDTNDGNIKLMHFKSRSLKAHVDDIIADFTIVCSHIICITETWLNENDEQSVEIPGYIGHFCHAGRGKGIAVYIKRGNDNQNEIQIKRINVQIMAISMEKLDVFVVYRSADFNIRQLGSHLDGRIHPARSTVISTVISTWIY